MALRTRKSLQLAPGIKVDVAQADVGAGLLVALIFGGIIWAIFN
ncbi:MULTISPECIES: hypothetical protein [unclassified Pseudomonas]|nr:hypothetical protein [Pseudomonas sp. M47T1]